MNESVRQLVRERAGDRCEYCQLSQEVGAVIRFHIEHVRPRQHGGDDDIDNLALACPNCNWSKGPNLAAVDTDTGAIVPLFNPRKDSWKQHFAYLGVELIGLTNIGRVTIKLLRMNSAARLEIRRESAARGELDANG